MHCLFALEGTSTLTVLNNTYNSNTSISSAPLVIVAGSNPISASIQDNIITENTCGGINLVLKDTELAEVTISGNTIASNGSGTRGQLGSAILIDPNTTTSGNCTLTLENNVIKENDRSGLYCSDGSYDVFHVTAMGNELTDNISGGFVFDSPANTFTFLATNNIITGGGDHGILTAGGITLTTATVTLSHNQITENTGASTPNGVALSHEGTNLTLLMDTNEISNNDGSAVIHYSSTPIENLVVTMENNTMNGNLNTGSGNYTGGIDLEQFINLTGTFRNNTLQDNVGYGLYIASTDVLGSACVEMIGNNSNTGYSLSNGADVFNLAPCNVDLVNTGIISVVGTVTLVTSCPDATPCPP